MTRVLGTLYLFPRTKRFFTCFSVSSEWKMCRGTCKIKIVSPFHGRGPESSVGIATGYGLDGPEIEFRWRRDFPHLSRPALGPSQPPIQWVPGFDPWVKSGRGVTLTPHPLLVLCSWKSRAIPLLPYGPYGLYRASVPLQGCTLPYLSAFTRVHFTFTFHGRKD